MIQKINLKFMLTRWYLFCGGFGGALGILGLQMDNWKFWVLLVYAVTVSRWVLSGKKDEQE